MKKLLLASLSLVAIAGMSQLNAREREVVINPDVCSTYNVEQPVLKCPPCPVNVYSKTVCECTPSMPVAKEICPTEKEVVTCPVHKKRCGTCHPHLGHCKHCPRHHRTEVVEEVVEKKYVD